MVLTTEFEIYVDFFYCLCYTKYYTDNINIFSEREMMFLKILITTDWYKSAMNGVATSVRNLESGLKQLGHDVKILTLSETRYSYENDNTTYIGSVNAERIYPSARVKIPLKSRLIQNLIDWKPDIIHSQCEFSTFSLARKISEVTDAPIVHTYHTIYEDYTHYFSPSIRLGKKAVKLFTRHISRYTDCIISPTEKVRNILKKYNCKVPIEVIPTGLDLDAIVSDKDDAERKAFRKSIGIPEDKRVILYAGRIAEEKNLDELIDFLGKNKPENAVFLVVGDGPYREQTEQKIKDSGLWDITIMTGKINYSQMKDYYCVGDIFVSASQSETQGLTYIEALANGLALLCKKDECLYEVLEEGVNGYFYTDEREFSDALNRLMTDDISALKKKAAEIAKFKFSKETFAEKIERVYIDLLK